MKQETINRLYRIMELVEKVHNNAIAGIATVICAPFLLIYEACKYITNKITGRVYDSSSKKWVAKEEYVKESAKETLRKKYENRELPLPADNHVASNKDSRFFFFKKRKLIIPNDQLVYVETEYNAKLHRFFEDNAEWIEAWQRWHGWDLVELDYDEIKEGMFYPQDFSVFKHGFLWRSPMSSCDTEFSLDGDIHYYYEIDPDSNVSIKEQMNRIMVRIYAIVDQGI